MSEKKGFDLNDFGGNTDAVLVQSNADAVMKNLEGQKCKQLEGSAWTALWGRQDVAEKLSADLGVDAIYFYFQDTSGWMGYDFFQNGEKVESYGFGEDFSELMEDAGADYTSPWDIETSDGETQWGFSGNLRKVSEEEIKKEEAFIDEFFKSQNAYLGWDALPID